MIDIQELYKNADDYAAAFSRLMSDLGIDEKVLLAGFVEKRDKLAAFVDSDVFVTLRFWGFPITFLESCLAGRPIVTASNELDWLNNNVGYVTEYSSDATAKATATLLQDEQVNRKFRNNSKHTIKKFGISTITRQVEEIYKEMILTVVTPTSSYNHSVPSKHCTGFHKVVFDISTNLEV